MRIRFPYCPKPLFPCQKPEVLNHACSRTEVFIPLFLFFRRIHNNNQECTWFKQYFLYVLLSFRWISCCHSFCKSLFPGSVNEHKPPWLSQFMCWCVFGVFQNIQNSFCFNGFIIIFFLDGTPVADDACQRRFFFRMCHHLASRI